MERKKKSIFDKIESRVPQDVKDKITRSFAISGAIHQIMKARGISKEALADLLEVEDDTVTKWLSGTHQFDEETIARIEKVLEKKIST